MKVKCKVCGKRFEALKENKYLVVKSNGLTGAINNNAETMFEAFDCPKCGCQHIANVRERNREDD